MCNGAAVAAQRPDHRVAIAIAGMMVASFADRRWSEQMRRFHTDSAVISLDVRNECGDVMCSGGGVISHLASIARSSPSVCNAKSPLQRHNTPYVSSAVEEFNVVVVGIFLVARRFSHYILAVALVVVGARALVHVGEQAA